MPEKNLPAEDLRAALPEANRRRFAPATERNREPILDVLRQVLPPVGTVLEIASGSGEHAIFFAPRLAPLMWQPSDGDRVAIDSIAAWQKEVPCDRLYPPIVLDASNPSWAKEVAAEKSLAEIAAIVCINMIHISPPAASLGLFSGAAEILPSGGILYLYGPFKRHGSHTAPSNAAFDDSLRSRNPDWGVRDLEEIAALAAGYGWKLQQVYPMPANNLSVVFQLADN
jgi:hypothetical protein